MTALTNRARPPPCRPAAPPPRRPAAPPPRRPAHRARPWQHSESWWPALFEGDEPVAWDDADKDYSDLPPEVMGGVGGAAAGHGAQRGMRLGMGEQGWAGGGLLRHAARVDGSPAGVGVDLTGAGWLDQAGAPKPEPRPAPRGPLPVPLRSRRCGGARRRGRSSSGARRRWTRRPGGACRRGSAGILGARCPAAARCLLPAARCCRFLRRPAQHAHGPPSCRPCAGAGGRPPARPPGAPRRAQAPLLAGAADARGGGGRGGRGGGRHGRLQRRGRAAQRGLSGFTVGWAGRSCKIDHRTTAPPTDGGVCARGRAGAGPGRAAAAGAAQRRARTQASTWQARAHRAGASRTQAYHLLQHLELRPPVRQEVLDRVRVARRAGGGGRRLLRAELAPHLGEHLGWGGPGGCVGGLWGMGRRGASSRRGAGPPGLAAGRGGGGRRSARRGAARRGSPAPAHRGWCPAGSGGTSG
jgi:hypothetical protein